MKNLEVRIQSVSDGGLAAQRNQPQIVVADVDRNGEVVAYCGPANDHLMFETMAEAELFARSPVVLTAAQEALKALENGDSEHAMDILSRALN